MDRDELAKALHDTPAYLTRAHAELLADAALAYFREYLGREETVERAAEAICDHTREMHRYEDLDAHNRRFWQEHARAALTAIAP